MPWGALAAGCATGLVISLAARLLAPSSPPGSVGVIMRAASIPLVISFAFLAYDPHRNLTAALPAPAWLTTAAHVAFAVPAVSLTASLQLMLAAAELHGGRSYGVPAAHLPWPSFLAQLTACSAMALAAAAIVSRSGWHDLGGALAAPAALAVATLLAVLPLRLLPAAVTGLTGPRHPARIQAEPIWWALGLLAALIACWASRDPWSRLNRGGRRARPLPAAHGLQDRLS
jgi:hypothetical protein